MPMAQEVDDDDWDDNEECKEFTPIRIRPGLYIGSCWAERNKEKLKAEGITHVLQVAEAVQPSHEQEFTYKKVHIEDEPSEDLVAHFHSCFAFMEDAIEQKGGVLVHCIAGVSRSATVCIGYLMWKEKLPFRTAFQEVQAVRPCVCPNEGFTQQLKEFERINYDVHKWRAWRHVWPETPVVVNGDKCESEDEDGDMLDKALRSFY